MKFKRTEIPDVIIVEPNLFGDQRGYFSETFRKDLFEEYLGYSVNFCQENESKSNYGVLRGLHYQLPPYSQSKLVKVMYGSVLDVCVDIRNGSPYFGKYVAIELSEENKKQLFVPRGFAHGFVVLSDYAIFSYKTDNYYSPNHDRGISYDSEELGIDWKIPKNLIKLSSKDKDLPNLKEIESYDYNLYL